MKTYEVTKPIAGYVVLTVEAESEEQAKQDFYKKVDDLTLEQIMKQSDDSEWDFYEKLVEGNIFYGTYYEMEINVIDEY